MSNILRFQMTRSPRRLGSSHLDDVDLLSPSFINALKNIAAPDELKNLLANTSLHDAFTQLTPMTIALIVRPVNVKRTAANAVYASKYVIAKSPTLGLLSFLVEFDNWLRSLDDDPTEDELKNELVLLAGSIKTRSVAATGSNPIKILCLDPFLWIDWSVLISNFCANIVINNSDVVSVELRGTILRLLSVFGLIAELAKNGGTLASGQTTFNLLHMRRIVIPQSLIVHLYRNNAAIRKLGFSDLYVIKEQWKEYQAGEIAHVENVLPHEIKRRYFERLDQEEQITSEETFKSEINSRESQSTDRFELHDAATQEFSIGGNVEFGNDTSTVAPGVTNNTHIGAGVEMSYAQSASRATSLSKEVVERSLNRIQSDVRKYREQRTLTRITQRDRHELNNQSGDAVSGVYRWLDKVKKVDLIRYPDRFLVELHLPEPGAWTRWLLNNKKQSQETVRDPGPFPQLLPQDITFDDDSKLTDYRYLTTVFEAKGIQPPPSTIILGTSLVKDPGDSDKYYSQEDYNNSGSPYRHYTNNTSVAVPAGWYAVSWKAAVSAHDQKQEEGAYVNWNPASIGILVGEENKSLVFQGEDNSSHARDGVLLGQVGNINSGTVPIAITTHFVLGYEANILVTCQPTQDSITQWQLDMYQLLRDAHGRQRQRYLDAQAVNQITAGISIEGLPPGQARALVRNEIKRQSIGCLLGGDFAGRASLKKWNATSSEPVADLNLSTRYAPEIQFLETTFDWSNATWIFYPYYWAAHGDWPDLALLQSSDPDFDEFLASGAARMTLPIRKGFEAQAQLYLDYGILWGGGTMPLPNDPEYLSVAEEIRELQKGSSDGELVDSWPVVLPTTLLILETNVHFPIQNPLLDPVP